MTITSEQLKHLANLAYLNIDPQSEPQLKADMNAIIQFVAQLQPFDTCNVEPLMHPMDAIQPLRPDEASFNSRLNALSNIAPQFENGLYWVPKVIPSER